MTLADIYNEYTAASQGFVIAVETHCGFCITRTEIERIAAKSATAEEFQDVYENDDSWADENND